MIDKTHYVTDRVEASCKCGRCGKQMHICTDLSNADRTIWRCACGLEAQVPTYASLHNKVGELQDKLDAEKRCGATYLAKLVAVGALASEHSFRGGLPGKIICKGILDIIDSVEFVKVTLLEDGDYRCDRGGENADAVSLLSPSPLPGQRFLIVRLQDTNISKEK